MRPFSLLNILIKLDINHLYLHNYNFSLHDFLSIFENLKNMQNENYLI